MSKTLWAHGSMILASLLVATSFPVVASISGRLDSSILTFFRFTLAATLFFPIVLYKHPTELFRGPRVLARYALLSLPLVGFFVAMFEALRTSNPVNTGALFTFAPAFTTLLSLFFLKESLPKARTLALLLAMLGTLWVIFEGRLERLLSVELVIGDAHFLAGTFSLAIYGVLVKGIHSGEPMAVVTFWTLATGALWLAAFTAMDLIELDHNAVSLDLAGAIAYLACFTTLVTFALTQSAIVVLGPTRAMAYNYLNPTLVLLLVWILNDGPLPWRIVPGIALTLASMFVLQSSDPVDSQSEEALQS